MKKLKISVTTDTAGDGSTTASNLLGRLWAVYWNKGTCSTGVDITVSTVQSEAAGNLLVVANADASKMYYPRALEHLSTSGADLTTHTEQVIAGTVKLVIAQGGNAKTGAVTIFYLDE